MADTPRIGPVGTYPKSGPLNEHDRSGIHVGLHLRKSQRLMEMKFGSTLQWLSLPPEAAMTQAQALRTLVRDAWGDLAYSFDGFPFTITASRERRVITISLPRETVGIVANPEVFLALAQRMVEAATPLLATPAS